MHSPTCLLRCSLNRSLIRRHHREPPPPPPRCLSYWPHVAYLISPLPGFKIFLFLFFIFMLSLIKGIITRNFRCLQMILKDRTWFPGVPLDVYFFKFMFSYTGGIPIKFKVLSGLSFYQGT